jgi:uncharacterized membrane protein
MKWIEKVASSLAFAGLFLLGILFVFDDKLQIPVWLQVAGRMHPLLLHLPITLLLISIVSYFIPSSTSTNTIFSYVRLFGALTAIFTAIMGILLATEEGTSGDTLQWHKWSGTAVAILAWILYSYASFIQSNKKLSISSGVLLFFLTITTGHFGATLTHGEGFLTAPLYKNETSTLTLAEARIYPNVVATIFKEKCSTFHNNSNKKGGLSLSDSVGIMTGGKSGKAVVAGDLLKSLVITRAHLPLSDKKHMPPSDKPQLTTAELAILEAWIQKGAPFDTKITSINSADTLRILAEEYIKPYLAKEEKYDFNAASEATIEKLKSNYRVIKQLGEKSPALAVSFYGQTQYNSSNLTELDPIKEQIVHLYAAKMPVSDADVSWISKLPNLKRLNVNYSNITDKSLAEIASMKKIKAVSVAGTAITMQGLKTLLGNKNITEIFVWDTKIKPSDIKAISKQYAQIKIDYGFDGADTLIITLNDPVISLPSGYFKENQPIQIKHVIKDVTIRYTLDGTDPDSSTSLIYKKPIVLDNTTTLSVRAFKAGWKGSATVRNFYMKAGLPIAGYKLTTPPDAKYNMNAATVLTDLDLADYTDFSSKWLGYQNNEATVILDMGSGIPTSRIMVNILRSTTSYILPPVSLMAWGSNDNKTWQQLANIKPEMPTMNDAPFAQMLELKYPTASFRYLKITGQPIKKLPSWHQGKGTPGWFFMSEITVN